MNFTRTATLISLTVLIHTSAQAQTPQNVCDPAVASLLREYSEAVLKSGFLRKPLEKSNTVASTERALKEKVSQDFAILQTAFLKAMKENPDLERTLLKWKKQAATKVRDTVLNRAAQDLETILNAGKLPNGFQCTRNKKAFYFQNQHIVPTTNALTLVCTSEGSSQVMHIVLGEGWKPRIRVQSSNRENIGDLDPRILVRQSDDFQWYGLDWEHQPDTTDPKSIKPTEARHIPEEDLGPQAIELKKMLELVNACKDEKYGLPRQLDNLPTLPRIMESEATRKEVEEKLKSFVEESKPNNATDPGAKKAK